MIDVYTVAQSFVLISFGIALLLVSISVAVSILMSIYNDYKEDKLEREKVDKQLKLMEELQNE